MYLSKLEIVGFKSFANKTAMRFDAGITAIVGPNGCGKTNVVDAIRWALGEQKVSTLRSDKMEDVIFNGTRNRKPLGMSEVSLTIENTRGILPTEYSEVTISRRLFRSGESEYLINMVPCRLKDIIDLFMDTGMGADAYSVIELKMIEVILSDKTEERRKLFEEAAGVTKYKQRRKSAYRKLEGVQQDLLRVNDIVKEVQKAVNSLERQAKKAEQYNEIAARLRALEVDLLEQEYIQLNTYMEPLQAKLVVAMDDKNRIDEELSRQEALHEVLQGELIGLESRLLDAQRGLSTQLERIRNVEQKNLVAAEQVKSLTANIARYEQEKIDLTNQRIRLIDEKREILRKREAVHQELNTRESDFTARKEELDRFEKKLLLKKTEAKEIQDRVIDYVHRIGETKGEQEKLKSRIENIRGRVEHLREENSYYREDIKEKNELVGRLSNEDRELRKHYAAAQVRLSGLENLRQQLKEEIDDLRNTELGYRANIDRKTSRIEFLQGLVERHEGMTDGAKYLMTSADWSPAYQITVGNLIATNERFRVAVEAALGNSAHFIVVNAVEDAYRGIQMLKHTQQGKATFVCLDKIPAPGPEKELPSTTGVLGWLVDVLTCDQQYHNLLHYLLDSVVLVEDIKAASACLGGVHGRSIAVCVTLDGEVVSRDGIVKGGSLRQDDGGLIGTKSQVKDLESELSDLRKKLRETQALIEEKQRQQGDIDTSVSAGEVKGYEKEMTAVEMRIAQVEFEKKRAGDSIQRNEEECSRLDQEISDIEGPLSEYMPRIQQLERERSEAEQNLGVVQNELEKLEADWDRHSTIVNDLSVQIATLKGEERNLTRESEHADETMNDIRSTLERRDTDIEIARKEIRQRETDQEENGRILQDLKAEFTSSEGKRDTVQQEYISKKDEIHAIQMKIRDERQLHDSSMNSTHDLEMKISELAMKAEHLVLRAREEFDIDLTTKVVLPAVSEPAEQFDFLNVNEEIRTLKEKLRALGSVNFAAFEEYTTEKERLEFLDAQRTDLWEAEKTLLNTIEEINTTAQQKFNDTFAQIRENFIAIFKGLFEEGDECDLRLEEHIDPLEARIEIIAKPRGKRPTSIDLLSGGEKTLTAIALLFAIYLVKPSPFCILDEVDAPLDDSNIDRFVRIIRRFSDNTQFIIVTHNKRTMESANAMYGVTMEEEGVSKLVSVRFKEGATVTAD
jgi:chromosome segregation protein